LADSARRFDIPARASYNPAMNLAQKIAVAVTLLAVAVFLFAGGARIKPPEGYSFGGASPQNWGQTVADVIGILLVGGVAVFLLGIRRKRSP